MADHPRTSEKTPLLPRSRHPCQGIVSACSHILSKESIASPSTNAPTLPHTNRSFSVSLRTKIILVMVAIPAYLLASSALTSLGSLNPRDSVARSPSPQSEPSPVPQTASTQPAPSSNPFASVQGPLVSSNFPDPAIIHVDGVSYAFATNNRGIGPAMIHVQVATSTDNQTWTLTNHDALPQVGSWETGARVWAPDVVQLVSGMKHHSRYSTANTCHRTTVHTFSTILMRLLGVLHTTAWVQRGPRMSWDPMSQ